MCKAVRGCECKSGILWASSSENLASSIGHLTVYDYEVSRELASTMDCPSVLCQISKLTGRWRLV